MPKIDELPFERMKNIDWEKVDEGDAIVFGDALASYNDAIESRAKAKEAFMSRVSSFVIAIIVGGVVSVGDPRLAVYTVMIALSIGVVFTGIRLRTAAKMITKKLDDFNTAINKLPHV